MEVNKPGARPGCQSQPTLVDGVCSNRGQQSAARMQHSAGNNQRIEGGETLKAHAADDRSFPSTSNAIDGIYRTTTLQVRMD